MKELEKDKPEMFVRKYVVDKNLYTAEEIIEIMHGKELEEIQRARAEIEKIEEIEKLESVRKEIPEPVFEELQEIKEENKKQIMKKIPNWVKAGRINNGAITRPIMKVITDFNLGIGVPKKYIHEDKNGKFIYAKIGTEKSGKVVKVRLPKGYVDYRTFRVKDAKKYRDYYRILATGWDLWRIYSIFNSLSLAPTVYEVRTETGVEYKVGQIVIDNKKYPPESMFETLLMFAGIANRYPYCYKVRCEPKSYYNYLELFRQHGLIGVLCDGKGNVYKIKDEKRTSLIPKRLYVLVDDNPNRIEWYAPHKFKKDKYVWKYKSNWVVSPDTKCPDKYVIGDKYSEELKEK